ncbi:MAG TPA: SCO family protein [Acetobacteraceae bacterium]|nr:SCO family protein [Acetobacteraceae bacterium]
MSTTTGHGTGRTSTFLFAVAGLVAAVLLLGAGGFIWLTGASGGPSVGGPFTLETSAGKMVTAKDFRGKYMLVYFGYTYCPDICPTTLNAVAAALDKLGPKANDLAPIFITVDPQRDTPQVMGRYTAAFSPKLIGLTGTPDEIAKVAREYRVYYAKHVTGPGPNDYSMDHSSIIYLMGPDGKFIAPIRADQSPGDMAADIGKLMS